MFYLQNASNGYLGNSPYWWRKGGSGYTADLDDAEKFTKEDAERIMETTRGTHQWKMWPSDRVDELSHREIDMQLLRSIKLHP